MQENNDKVAPYFVLKCGTLNPTPMYRCGVVEV